MKSGRLVLEPAKGALILCAISMVLAFAGVIGLAHYHKAKETVFVQKEGELQAARSEIQTLNDDLASLEAHLTSFNHLVSIGLIGDPEREAWVQKLEAIHQALDLPPTLRYALAPPRLLFDDQDAAAGALPPSQTSALRHDLDIELSGIHEGEFLALLDTLRTDWQTPFRIETCQMRRDADAGLQVKCTLRLFSLPLVKDGQPAGS